jgi:hypothetical protein
MAPYRKLEYYVDEDETIPFKQFIRRLKTRQERADCFALIELLRSGGDELDGMQHLTHNHDVHEFRDDAIRIFYVYEGDGIVILDCLLPIQGNDLSDIYRKAEDYGRED